MQTVCRDIIEIRATPGGMCASWHGAARDIQAELRMSVAQRGPAEKLKQALDVTGAGIRLKRCALRRQFPDAADTEVDHRRAEWLHGDG